MVIKINLYFIKRIDLWTNHSGKKHIGMIVFLHLE
jgi:hypothetical protein